VNFSSLPTVRISVGELFAPHSEHWPSRLSSATISHLLEHLRAKFNRRALRPLLKIAAIGGKAPQGGEVVSTLRVLGSTRLSKSLAAPACLVAALGRFALTENVFRFW
jgi:hypothetical protein